MARVVILSSFVACGHVGLSAGQPVLQALGHEVIGLPSVVLSNHPGLGVPGGAVTPVDQLHAMVGALFDHGLLKGADALQTGYLPTPDHVDLAVGLIDRLRADLPALRVVVDPVFGDAPGGLYLPEPVAGAIAKALVPRADIITPNRFEADWLAQRGADTARVVETSAEVAGRFGVLDHAQDTPTFYPVQRHGGVPHGTGDALAAFLAAGVSLGQALGYLQCLIKHSLGAPHLAIAASQPHWTEAPAHIGEPHGL
ncbi:bifunctional hydroxymethylpyrimidine kinase/phosphomethylpyrimidine kinase [Sagittula sp. SSi028]|uniref:bifunctional hydroxymethylpyrimidine kinase/phosphomethylpyrimidine kinase n=1 Tax=Sagittula sp. SSi028 TaxID=3400636 RepID=UPI003AF9EABC